ncbi:glycosyltransferase family 2 protein [Planococcus shixiaomingii]|uniref:glycosyltransferase family 2 protein n=1 Tax=Planococcus shixiaomingii TaxID=3058393 RepID=UPI002611AD89|nr:glycosyltransferase family 2 protein [Planococcus sp. N022]WKA53973.1 glycosyltransferase family 2 protein [Planococcus sp. N022]
MNNIENIRPLISVIMPAYNAENYIEDAINSVLSQSYEEWELIIIDDCSSDKTLKIAEKLSNNDSRLKLIKNSKNIGVSETRNKAINLALGEWIAFLDSDDLWENAKLEKQIAHANKVGASFVFTGSSYINKEGKPFKGVFEVPESVDFNKLKRQNVIPCSSVLVRKECFETIRMERDNMHEDYAAWLRILKSGILAFGVNEPLLVYRLSVSSKSGNKFKTIGMNYRVFRSIEMNPVSSVYFAGVNLVNSLKKYNKILFKNKKIKRLRLTNPL